MDRFVRRNNKKHGPMKAVLLAVQTKLKFCHCETVRTLSWQSVLFKIVHIPGLRDTELHTKLIGHRFAMT